MGNFKDLISMDLIEAAIGELEEETRLKRISMQQSKSLERQKQQRERVKSWQSDTTSDSLPAIEESKLDDEFWVTWENDEDPTNPRNWTTRRKWFNVAIIAMQATICPMLSTIMATCDLNIAEDFQLDNIYVISLPVALFVLGLGVGPIFFAPYSELYGKRKMYVVGYWIFTIINVGCAWAPNMAVLATLRLLAGMAGSAGPALGGSSMGDMFAPANRGKAQAIHTFVTNVGPVFGAIVGGVLLNALGTWRWLLRIMSFVSLCTSIATTIWLKETYAPYILELKAQRLRKETGDNNYISRPPIDMRLRIAQAFSRPVKLFVSTPICFVMTMYSSFVFGIYYLYLTNTPLLFNPRPSFGLFTYQWAQELVGLAYLSAAIGGVFGMLILVLVGGRAYRYMTERYGIEDKNGVKQGRPEFRMPFLGSGMFIVPFGLLIFAWTAQNQTHWIGPMVGNTVFAMGMIMVHASIQTYMVDSYEGHAASALAALVLMRSLVGAIFSVVGFNLYKTMNYGWGSTILAFIALAMLPIPILLYIYGPRLRAGKAKPTST